MYNVLEVAAYVIEKSVSDGFYISNLKLQKILYYVQANFLVSKGKKCFKENIEAWSIGPVIPKAYRKYKAYGTAAIPVTLHDKKADAVCASDRPFIDEIIEACRYYSATDLTEISRQQNPWKKAYKKGETNIISVDSLKDFWTE